MGEPNDHTGLDDDVLDEARSRSETLDLLDLIELLETHRVESGRGVTRERIDEYAAALDYDPDRIEDLIDERVVDSRDWTSGGALYRLDGERISAYPPRWHDELADTTDLTEHVGLIHSSVTAVEGDEHTAVTEAGVPEEMVVKVACAVSGMDRDTAYSTLQDLRKKGRLEEHADQHRASQVRLP